MTVDGPLSAPNLSSARFESLSEPVAGPDFDSFVRHLRTFKPNVRAARMERVDGALRLILALCALVILSVFPYHFVTGGIREVSSPTSGIVLVLNVVLIVVGVAVAALMFWVFAKYVKSSVRFTSPWKRWFRISRLAGRNGMHFLPSSPRPAFSSTIFSSRYPGTASDRLIVRHNAIEIGNYRRSRMEIAGGTAEWGYLAMRLNRTLPHIVLRARAHERSGLGLPAKFASSQTLSLEGDFDKHFRLYAPSSHKRDALYVFAPDLMALMIDHVAALDVEIIDQDIFFISPHRFDLTSKVTLERLFRIADVVGAKTFRQTDRYWDHSAGGTFTDNFVAPQGRRLERAAAVGFFVLLGLWALMQVLNSTINQHF